MDRDLGLLGPCRGRGMERMTRPSLQRNLVGTALIGLAVCMLGHVYSIRDKLPPLNCLDLTASLSFLPILGAGLLMPFRRPLLGTFLGFLALIVFLLWIGYRALSV